MKLTQYLALFLGVSVCFFSVLFYNIDKETAVNRLNLQYASNISSACEDAAKTIDGNLLAEGCVWKTKEQRQETLNVFYHTLEYNFHAEYGTRRDELKLYTPLVCLIDNNGCYISYNAALDDTSQAIVAEEYEQLSAVSGLNTWSKEYSGVNNVDFTCSFHLDQTVEMICSDGKIFSGERHDVFAKLEKVYGSGTLYELNFLNSDDFQTEKNSVIISAINHTLEYYMNEQNMLADRTGTKYSLTMPEIAGEDWCRLLESPSIIAFLQGPQTNVRGKIISIYALAGGEYKPGYHYFITKEGNESIYHCVEAESDVEEKSNTDSQTDMIGDTSQTMNYDYKMYEYKGDPIEKFYPNMESCALAGAQPCQCNH